MAGELDVRLDRRAFIGAAGGAVLLASGRAGHGRAATARGPFAHGVASGDPLADRVVLWTRVTPSAAAVPGSGVGPPVDVRWEIARDPRFRRVCARGTVRTDAARDHTVKVDPTGLEPATDHWYRFHALGATSPVGRTRTLPASRAVVDRIRLGVVSCAEYEFGWFGAYRHLARRDDVDAVLHLGDYIYEFGIGYGQSPKAATPGPAMGRSHDPPRETVTLADYRTRYGQYRTDPDLQALHAAHPVIAVWDDHEIANDSWREGAGYHDPEDGPFPVRAAAARRAWREWLPVRQVDRDPEVIHRSFRFGDLVDLWMLDARRYRDAPAANAFVSYGSVDPAINDPSRTLLGPMQEAWLVRGLRSSTARWSVLGNPVMFSPFVVGPPLLATLGDALAEIAPVSPPLPPPLLVDDWNGYAAERDELLGVIAGSGRDVVILTGDYHESFAIDVPRSPDGYGRDGGSVAVELVVPSVTTPGTAQALEAGGLPDATLVDLAFDANLAANNPWVRYHESRSRGFSVVELGRDRTQCDFVFVDDVLDPRSGARVASSWQVGRGERRLSPAPRPLAPRRRA